MIKIHGLATNGYQKQKKEKEKRIICGCLIYLIFWKYKLKKAMLFPNVKTYKINL